MTKEEFHNKKNLYGQKTHSLAIKLIELDLIKKAREDYKIFQKLIPELKQLREKSDYENVGISQEQGWMARNHSDSIKNILTKNYKA